MLKIFLPALLLSLSCVSQAELIVVADMGGESTASLFEVITSPDAPEKINPSALSSLATVPLTTAVFPIVSSRLHPGEVVSRPLSLPGMTPLFIIGDDPLSEYWLTNYRTKLKSLNAIGLVVNVASQEKFEGLQRLVNDLTLFPVSGDDLAQRLQFDAYPVLITDTELSQ